MKVAYDSERDRFSIVGLDLMQVVRLSRILRRGLDSVVDDIADGPLGKEKLKQLGAFFESADLVETMDASIKLRRRLIGK
jgi:hypothetical protein